MARCIFWMLGEHSFHYEHIQLHTLCRFLNIACSASTQVSYKKEIIKRLLLVK